MDYTKLEEQNKKLIELVKGYLEELETQKKLVEDKEKIIKNQKKKIEELLKQIGGRPQKVSDKILMEIYKEQGKTTKELAEMFNCSIRTVSRILKKGKEEK